MTNPEIQPIVDAIRAKQRFVIASHSRPDGDSIGSALAAAYALRDLGKHVTVVNADAASPPLMQFPGVPDIQIADRVEGDFDAAIIMECGDLARTGVAGLERYFVINIDHHPGNSAYGQLNWFDPTAAACGEMVFDLVRALDVPLTTTIATHIYLAILTDTGSFHYSSISPRTFDICRETLEAGVDPVLVARNVYDSNNMGRLKLFGAVLSAMQIDATGRIAIVYLDHEMARRAGGTYEDTEGIINLPLTVKEIQSVVFFKESEGGQYRVSMRSKGDVDIAAVAKQFGGGGHKNAAGCTVTGPLDDLRKTFVEKMGKPSMDGLLIVDKPAGPTSHEVVARVRRALDEPRVGHTGTLDPAATGVMALVLGRATRLAQFLSAGDKSYDAVVRLGVATDTRDAEGTPLGAPHQGPWPSRETIDRALDAFRGTFEQQPPAFSAKKVDGERSYRTARRAKRQAAAHPARPALPAPPPLPAPVSVTVRALDTVSLDGDCVTLRVTCSAGFYVRALAHDLGERLGVGAHLLALRRTRSGDVTLDDALGLETILGDPQRAIRAVVPLSRMLPGLFSVTLTSAGVRRAVHGRDLGCDDTENGEQPFVERPDKRSPLFVRLLDPAGELVAIATLANTPGLLHPSVVLM